ncbi:hypothetical protein [Enterobacter asburiae]|uniref:hypothetical protein n=1 Tax=Enterobacter asburiae TaxID=61645 RepID=UPI0021CFCD39|nr:hypothetical protein [Enterobacter asburiae]MCU6244022.1 hypothetical protein [Enterobacter asburiae]
MKDYPNEDDITEQLGDMIKPLSAATFPERDNIVEMLTKLHSNMLEEYDWWTFTDDAFNILKLLLKAKLRLKKTQTNDESLIVISSSVQTLRTLLLENKKYVYMLIRCDQTYHIMRGALFLAPVIILVMVTGWFLSHYFPPA